MKVTLINHTQNAIELLLFTKSTRLGLSPGLMDEISSWSEEKKFEELQYMANTVPSSWEFVDYSFLIEGVSRAFTHQLVRTRTGSYAQQAMRVVDMGEYEYVFTDPNRSSPQAMRTIATVNAQIQGAYSKLLKLGQNTEDARGVLPTNIATNIICKFNLRAFADLVKSRIGGRTQDEYRSVVEQMVEGVLAVHPWAEKFIFAHDRDRYDDLEAFARDLPKDQNWELLKIVDKLRKDG